MARNKKQGKNDSMDEWLEHQGYYRKHIAKDGSCLFRAVSEQVFNTQALHFNVRTACIKYMERHKEQFEPFVEGPFDHHLFNLQNPKEWAGQIEMFAMSLMYKRDFIVFQEPDRQPYQATDNGFADNVLLCFSQGNHYDSVYPKTIITNAAFCQSMIYELLYKEVFQLGEDVNLAVHKMLHDKVYAKHRKDSTASQDSNWDKSGSPSPDLAIETPDLPLELTEDWKGKDAGFEIRRALALGIPPFPYKVAKALDPEIYRNVEFDVWNDLKTAEEPLFEPGTKCLVRIDKDKDEVYHAHVQEINGEKRPVTVFIEELGEKLTISYEALEPLPSLHQKVNQWQSSVKNYRTLSGYYQKAPLSNDNEVEKYRSRKKINKKKQAKEAQISFNVPFGRGQPLPPRLQPHHVQFETPTSITFNRPQNNSSLMTYNRSPSPRMKWSHSSQQNQRFYGKSNSSSRYMNLNSGTNSPTLDDCGRKVVTEKELFDIRDQELSSFPALPMSQAISQQTSSCPLMTGAWRRSNNHINQPSSTSSQSETISQLSQQDSSSGESKDGNKDISAQSSCTSTLSIPLIQSNSPVSSAPPLSLSSNCSSFSVPLVPSPLTPAPSPSSPIPIPSSLSSPLQSLPQLILQSQQHSMPQPLQMPVHQLPSMTPQHTPPPPPMAYSFVSVPPMCSGLIMPYNDTPSHAINYNVGRSHDPSGNDLPLSDLPTLRFFFNLGYDYFRMSSMLPTPQHPQYAMWNYGSQMSYSSVNGYPNPLTSENGSNMEDPSCTSNGFYPNSGSSAGTPTVLASSPAVYYSPPPYMYQQPPSVSSLPPVPFMPATVQ